MHIVRCTIICFADSSEVQLIEQSPDHNDRPPVGGIDHLQIPVLGSPRIDALAQQTIELGKDLGEWILAVQVSDGALLLVSSSR